jgi:glycosyltransferase involved in cell wall biosynthesis
MRTLVIAGDYPWPTDTGARLRLAMILRGLRRCGPTELFSVVSKFRTDFGPPDSSMDLARVDHMGFDNRPAMGVRLIPTLWRPSMPFDMPWRDGPLVQRAVDRFMTGQYELVWFFGPRPWVLTGGPSWAPTVVDLIDLEDQKILARLSVPRPPATGAAERARRAASTLVAEEEVRRWQRLHRRIGRQASAVAVCSRLDAERATVMGVERVAVIPNGYEAVRDPVGRDTVGSPPAILFQGLLSYPPNAEASRLLANEIGPAVRTLVPSAQIRLVGDHRPDLLSLHDPPRVTVTGRVDDMDQELARADLVVVPLRYGSGTRLKILEAFAQRIPVVSTSLGAEGLGAVDGVHLLIADSVPALAKSCARLLTDIELRREVTARAHALFLERFASDVIEDHVARLALEVVDGKDHPPTRPPFAV